MEKELNWTVIGTGVIANEMAQALQKMGKTLYGVANRTQTDLKEVNSKSLVIYFSWVGSTQNIAKEIQKQTNSTSLRLLLKLLIVMIMIRLLMM